VNQRYFSTGEIDQFGFKSVGKNLLIDRSAIIIGAANISFGNDVRIDAFVMITAGEPGVIIGNHVHIGAGSYLFGGAGIKIDDFVGLSGRVSIYSASDDYSGEFLTNPTIPQELRGIHSGRVVLDKHVIVGAGSIIMPNIILGIGCAIGALTFVRNSVAPFAIVHGNPMKIIGERKQQILELEKSLFTINTNK